MKRGCLPGSEPMLSSRSVALACQPEMLREHCRSLAKARLGRRRHARVQESPPCQPHLLIDQRTQLLVRELIRGLAPEVLSYHPAPDELVERCHCLFVGSAAGLPQRL